MYDVTVIIPYFNSSCTIERAIQSALCQSSVSVEVIVINDCSSDDSFNVVKNLALQENRIKLFSNVKNSGPGYSRNIGIDNATGDYIAFLDADDVWLPDKLACQIEFMRAGKLEFTYHDYYEVIVDKNAIVSTKRIMSPDIAMLPKYFYTRGYGMCLTSIISRNALGNVRFPIDRSISTEDYGFFLRLLSSGVIGYRFPKALGIYTVAKDSRSSNKFKQGMSVLKCNLTFGSKGLFVSVFYFIIYGVIQLSLKLMGSNFQRVSERDLELIQRAVSGPSSSSVV